MSISECDQSIPTSISTPEITCAICKDAKEIHFVNKECLPVFYSPLEYVLFILNKQSIVLKATYCDKIVGYILGKFYSDTRLHIMSISVLKDYRRLGIGKMLIDKITKYGCNEKHTLKKITLYVQKTNTSALQFYKKLGFYEKDFLKDYYGKDDHGYYMVLDNLNR